MSLSSSFPTHFVLHIQIAGDEEHPCPPTLSSRRRTATPPKEAAKTNAVGCVEIENAFTPSSQGESLTIPSEDAEKLDT
jgi:hypothetical protein